MLYDESTKPRLVALKTISQVYSMPLSTLRRWSSERRFPLYKISNRIFVDIDEFNEWVSKHKIEGVKNGGRG